jgi:hypothetical protein
MAEIFRRKLDVNKMIWLDQHGGRTIRDLQEDDQKGFYVMMADGFGGETKRFLDEKWGDDEGE